MRWKAWDKIFRTILTFVRVKARGRQSISMHPSYWLTWIRANADYGALLTDCTAERQRTHLCPWLTGLKHPNLKWQPLLDRTIRHKLRKYGTVENPEVWGHDTSQFHYVVLRDPNTNVGTLLTVYKRHPSYEV